MECIQNEIYCMLTKKYIDEDDQHLCEKVAMRNEKERDKSNTNAETRHL